MKLSAKDITTATGGWVEKLSDIQATGVSIDTRTIKENDVFFALKGPNFDGHSFLNEAVAAGACGLVVEEKAKIGKKLLEGPADGKEIFIIRVGDTLRALGDLASDYREKYSGKVVAVTGSNGKTTTKEMISSILGVKWNVAKSPGNFNNLIGVPLSIFKAESEHHALVLEAGMNRPGEIGRITDISSPDVGVITSIAPAHLEKLKGINGIKEAKGELLVRMKLTAAAVINADDQNVARLAPRFQGRVLTFGIRPGADIRADKMVARVDGRTSFDLVTGEGRIRIQQAFLGLHNIYNALAASAAATALGFNLQEIKKGLAACRPLPMRLEMINLPGGFTVINDSYNANPGSVKAAVETFLTLVVKGRRLILLGDMLELGEESRQAHRDIGQFIAEKGIDLLITVGREAEAATAAFNETAGPGRKGRHATDHLEAASIIVGEIQPGDLVLVKGSRGMELENAVLAIRELLSSAGTEKGGD